MVEVINHDKEPEYQKVLFGDIAHYRFFYHGQELYMKTGDYCARSIPSLGLEEFERDFKVYPVEVAIHYSRILAN